MLVINKPHYFAKNYLLNTGLENKNQAIMQ
jgi:hypothetical protein